MNTADLTPKEAALYERYITPFAMEIASRIGTPLTILLIAKCGGNTFQLHGDDLDYLEGLLGSAAILKLKKWIGASCFTIPICDAANKVILHARLRSEFDRLTVAYKLSARKAVRILTHSTVPPIHERTVWKILKQTDEPNVRVPRRYYALFRAAPSNPASGTLQSHQLAAPSLMGEKAAATHHQRTAHNKN